MACMEWGGHHWVIQKELVRMNMGKDLEMVEDLYLTEGSASRLRKHLET